MADTKLYIIRHGKTLYNTWVKTQGWSDTPLTEEGEKMIHSLGANLNKAGIDFKTATSSDSGRAIQTMDILLEELDNPMIPFKRDRRIREWNFGSAEGGDDMKYFHEILPATKAFGGRSFHDVSLEQLAQGIMEIDEVGMAENWETVQDRYSSGFGDIAKQLFVNGGGNGLVVSHGIAITTFCKLIDPTLNLLTLKNGSVTEMIFDGERFKIEDIGNTKYVEEL